MRATLAALRRATAARRQLDADRARCDTQTWVVKRRERTRQLIELGGLVVKSGIVELVDDDRAIIYGALIEIVELLKSPDRDRLILLWRRRGKRAFDASNS